MAEHDEAPQKPPDEPLEAANNEFWEARKRRANAKVSLQKAKSDLADAEQTVTTLQAKRHQLQKQEAENPAALERLARQIPNTEQAVATLQADLHQLQNQSAWRPRALLARLLRKPARLARQIQVTQQTVATLQAEREQRQKQQAENPAALERLNPEIEEAERKRDEQEEEVKKCQDELKEAKSAVVEKASDVREKASEKIMEQARSSSPNSPEKLAGGVYVGYVSVLATNLSYNYLFYSFLGISIFSYSAPQDFAIPQLESLISANVFLWIFFIRRYLEKIKSPTDPKGIEEGAGWLYSKAKWLESWKGTLLFLLPLFLLSFIIVPSFGGGVAGWIAHKRASKSDETVNVITVRELKSLNNLVHIGSSSTHEFFRRKESNDAQSGQAQPSSTSPGDGNSRENNNVIAVPLSGIVCIADTKSGCQSKETTDDQRNAQLQAILDELQKLSLKKENNLWISELTDALKENVTENEARRFIDQKMKEKCGENQSIEVSKFIRFDLDKAELNPSRKNEKDKASTFVKAVQKRGGQLAEWTVFGFASADGEIEKNKDLSLERAGAVRSLLCEALKYDRKNGAKVAVEGLSEDHPINGVANSRSARIAVCLSEEAE